MTNTEQLEITIRTAQLIKSLSSLVGARDARLAKMMFAESVTQYGELGKFIDKCITGQGKGTTP